MGVFPTLPPDYETWMFAGGAAVARRDVLDALRAALDGTTLYEWAEHQDGREPFTGRGTAYGVSLGTVPVVVRHARRGGVFGRVIRDRYFGSPRFLREIAMSHHLASAGIATPAVVAAIEYPAGFGHRADVATQRIAGRDLAAVFFGEDAPQGETRGIILREVGSMIRRLHHAGFVHPDLQLRNILIQPYPLPTPLPHQPLLAWLLDVDTCRAVGKGEHAAHKANLARFARSWEKLNKQFGLHLTDADRAAFAVGYADKA